MDLSLRFCECLIRAEVYSEEEEEGLACLEERAGEGGGTLGSLVDVWLITQIWRTVKCKYIVRLPTSLELCRGSRWRTTSWTHPGSLCTALH